MAQGSQYRKVDQQDDSYEMNMHHNKCLLCYSTKVCYNIGIRIYIAHMDIVLTRIYIPDNIDNQLLQIFQ